MVSEMMIFVGTEYAGGPQFHVWVEKTGDTEELVEAISKHQNLGGNDFILQHVSMPLLPYTSLSSQRIRPYSTVHMFRLSDLKAQDQARKLAAKKEAEERGRYITKDGTDRLRRRTRQALALMKEKKEKERLGGGLVPCYAELERIAREYQGDEARGKDTFGELTSGPSRGNVAGGGRRGSKILLTTAPLQSLSSGKDKDQHERRSTGRVADGSKHGSAAGANSPSSSSCSRTPTSSVPARKRSRPTSLHSPPRPPPKSAFTRAEPHGSIHTHTLETGATSTPSDPVLQHPPQHRRRRISNDDGSQSHSSRASPSDWAEGTWYSHSRREITPPLPQFQTSHSYSSFQSHSRPFAHPYPSPTPSRSGKDIDSSLYLDLGPDVRESGTNRSIRTVRGMSEEGGTSQVAWLGR